MQSRCSEPSGCIRSSAVLQDADVSTDTLLFVDDNEDLRKYIRMTFGDSYQVVDVESAEAAL